MQLIIKHKYDLIAIVCIIIFSLFIRVISLNNIPPNITGDESWDLSNIYRILYDDTINPLSLLGDGANIALIFYPVAMLSEIFGISHSILFLRLNIVIFSILSLLIFYLILKKYTSIYIAFIFTMLLSSNYVFLNFSRTAWVNMLTIFFSLSVIYFLERAVYEKKYIHFMFAGIFGGLGFYVYHFGKIFFIGILVYLIIRIITEKFNKNIIKGSIIFFFTTLLVLSPLIFSINNERANSILTRPSSTFAFSQVNIDSSEFTRNSLLKNQLINTIRGFILLDKSVSSNGVENTRYVPLKSSPVNIFIQILFIVGIFSLMKKKYLIWWVIILFILLIQIITILPPNFARGLLFIPIIYLIVAIFVYELISKVNHKKINVKIVYLIISIVSICVIFWDVNKYFQWMNTDHIKDARQPAIDYNEYSVWQDYQLNLVKNGNYPITNQQWYEIRNLYLKN